MYAEFIAWVLDLVQTLNDFEKRHQGEDDTLVPYAYKIPLMMDSDLVGFVVDEIGGTWSYRDATEAEKEQHRNR